MLHSLGLRSIGARAEHWTSVSQQLAENPDDVFGLLALTKHDFRKTRAQCSMVIDSRKTQVCKRKFGQPLQRGVYLNLPRRNPSEQFF